MSYCRVGLDESDVYLYKNLDCHFVLAVPGKRRKIIKTPRQCYKELMKLRKQGLVVPQSAVDRVLKECI